MSNIATKKKLDIPFSFDLMVKKIFANECFPDSYRTLIKRTLDMIPKRIIILNNELISRPYRDKKNDVDLMYEIDGCVKLNYEINT